MIERSLLRTLALLTLLAGPASGRAEECEGKSLEGCRAPSFALSFVSAVPGRGWGETRLSLDDLVGENPSDPDSKVVLLVFYGTQCGPCRAALPSLVELDRDYRALGLRVLGVLLENLDLARLAEHMAKEGVTFPVTADRYQFVARRYFGTSAPLPAMLTVNRAGEVTRVEFGNVRASLAAIRAEVEQQLGVSASVVKIAPEGRPAPSLPPKEAILRRLKRVEKDGTEAIKAGDDGWRITGYGHGWAPDLEYDLDRAPVTVWLDFVLEAGESELIVGFSGNKATWNSGASDALTFNVIADGSVRFRTGMYRDHVATGRIAPLVPGRTYHLELSLSGRGASASIDGTPVLSADLAEARFARKGVFGLLGYRPAVTRVSGVMVR